MTIRKTLPKDLGQVLEIYRHARQFMKETGNPTQWEDTWPPASLVEDDIRQGKSFVCVEDSGDGEIILGVFFLEAAPDSTYDAIYEGSWLAEDAPYGVVHRIASSGKSAGVGAFCLEWALEQCGNIRIDTHEANLPMQNLLKKLGYRRCGIINTHDGSPRVAFQKIT